MATGKTKPVNDWQTVDDWQNVDAGSTPPASAKPPSPNPMGMANQLLAKYGLSVGPPPNSNLRTGQEMDLPGVLNRFLTSAGASLPSGQGNPYAPMQRLLQTGGKEGNIVVPFGTPSGNVEQVKNLATEAGSGDIAGALGTLGGQAAQLYAMHKVGQRLNAQTPTNPAGPELLKESSGQKFQQVLQNAGNIPIDVTDAGNIALRTRELAASGGSMPKVVRDFLNRITQPNSQPMTYAEARDFYSNATRLSSDEFNRLTPVMKKQVAEFTDALGKANARAAAAGGEGETYASGMRGYAKGAEWQKSNQKMVDLTKKIVGYGVPAGIAGLIAREIMKQ